jgi:pyridoxine/pyridoxamine 5'-phosphate oxidase
MTREDIIRMALEAGFTADEFAWHDHMFEHFAALIAAAEREQITDEWSMCVQSDLEHGVKSLSEQAAKDWFKNYPETAKFGEWLSARGQA